ncbi:MAG: eL32 family ribosomal protein [Candidatus Marsarchaeota archaeon]|jgi:ribosomal protein L32E|nr:eL32 family ribosomal protein [Candidatus Marsarchaeota archaeon]MCL5419304.1 eL32 family ribosomal protein [Candidatus Marsarchaeota archaeon]
MEKKKHPRFVVPNYGAPNRKRVKYRWRAQTGMDSKKRVKKSESGASPSIGYKNSRSIRYARADGTFEALIHNESELLALISAKEGKTARFVHNLSSRKRARLQVLADRSGIKVANRMTP